MSQIKGLERVLKMMERDKKEKAKRVARNLKRAGLALLGWSQDIVPVDQGNLKATGQCRSTGNGFETVVTVSYGTDYGIYVHENLDALHGAAYNEAYAAQIAAGLDHSRGPEQRAKFLTGPLRERHDELMEIIGEDL